MIILFLYTTTSLDQIILEHNDMRMAISSYPKRVTIRMSQQVYFFVVNSDFQNDAGFDMGTVNADPNETIAALKEKVSAEIGFPKMKFKVYADKSTALSLTATVGKHGSDPANALMIQLIENRSTGTAQSQND